MVKTVPGTVRLPDAELEVLACLKRQDEGTAAELRAELDRQRPMTHGSMMTLLGRLQCSGGMSPLIRISFLLQPWIVTPEQSLTCTQMFAWITRSLWAPI